MGIPPFKKEVGPKLGDTFLGPTGQGGLAKEKSAFRNLVSHVPEINFQGLLGPLGDGHKEVISSKAGSDKGGFKGEQDEAYLKRRWFTEHLPEQLRLKKPHLCWWNQAFFQSQERYLP